uniref:Caffeoyl-CoA O-methyltransferase n=1 Tax=Aegilops tauschii subsp. strangulata TaxID=200361 RepID=A0A452XKQ3_AEGTS
TKPHCNATMAASGSDVNASYNIKHLLKSDALYKYILDTTVFPREPECMRDLRLLTDNHQSGIMQSTPEEAQLLQLLIKIAGARNTIEVGVFTGYSLLATALVLPEDGKVVAIDVNRKDFELGLPFIQKAGVAHKVDFREGKALDHLDELLAADPLAQYDFAFVDADKQNYGRYHEQLMRLVRVGGTIVYDNTLWGGTVAGVAVPSLDVLPGVVVDGVLASIAEFLKGFNAELAADPRVDVCQIAVGDGLTICRRLV